MRNTEKKQKKKLNEQIATFDNVALNAIDICCLLLLLSKNVIKSLLNYQTNTAVGTACHTHTHTCAGASA